jgi:hypothetical protein
MKLFLSDPYISLLTSIALHGTELNMFVEKSFLLLRLLKCIIQQKKKSLFFSSSSPRSPKELYSKKEGKKINNFYFCT